MEIMLVDEDTNSEDRGRKEVAIKERDSDREEQIKARARPGSGKNGIKRRSMLGVERKEEMMRRM